MGKTYPKQRSCVTVVFHDGEVAEHEISAGASLGSYLAETAGTTGVLHLIDVDNNRCHSIPIVNVRDWAIETITTKGESDEY